MVSLPTGCNPRHRIVLEVSFPAEQEQLGCPFYRQDPFSCGTWLIICPTNRSIDKFSSTSTQQVTSDMGHVNFVSTDNCHPPPSVRRICNLFSFLPRSWLAQYNATSSFDTRSHTPTAPESTHHPRLCCSLRVHLIRPTVTYLFVLSSTPLRSFPSHLYSFMVSTRAKNKDSHPATPVMTPAAKRKAGIKEKPQPKRRTTMKQSLRELEARLQAMENPSEEQFSKEPLVRTAQLLSMCEC